MGASIRAAASSEHLRVLISEERLQARIRELGAQIRAEYGDGPITCIAVLKGSFMFMADLVRAIGGDIRCEFLGVSSYHGGTRSTGVVRITEDLSHPIEGQDCLIVEDIVDTGLTMDYLIRMLETRGPRSLKICSLLDKPAHREVQLQADYVGFSIPDEFVVGYGLDLGERFRNLPHIAVYTP
jgi:hypoxanthine phosphoribosyltransferase